MTVNLIYFFTLLCFLTVPLMGEARYQTKKQLTSSVFPRTDPKVVGLIYQMLKAVDAIFGEHGICYWIDGGTALGAVRHQGVIPWDDDADLVFFMEDEARIFALANEFAKYGFYLKKDGIFRLYPSLERMHPCIDIAGYSLFPDNTLRFEWEAARLAFPNFYWLPEEVATLQRVKFGPIELNAPNEMMRYLLTGYGSDCMSTAMFQTHHEPGQNVVIIKQKAKIVDFGPADYEIDPFRNRVELPVEPLENLNCPDFGLER